MPQYPKTTRVELWRTSESYQDSAGAWHQGRPTQVATWWGNLKGRTYELTYDNARTLANPCFDLTITRPKFTQPRVGDHIRHDGSFFIVRQINELTGQVGHDVRLTCELDEDFRVM